MSMRIIHTFFQDLAASLQFLTILPVGGDAEFRPGAMVRYFPLVGLILGALLSLVDHVLGWFCPPDITALLGVIWLMKLTGAFHLDGLGDAADGLLGHRTREQALGIMKDSRIGVMALVVIVSALAVKWAGIAHLSAHRSLILVLVPAYARFGMVLAMHWLPYARPEGGTGQAFWDDPRPLSNLLWGLVPMGLSLCVGWPGALILNLVFGVTIAALILFYRQRLGGITGDLCGATAEITESTLFLTAALAGGL